MNNIAIFASGNGTNAEALILHFKNHPSIRVSLVLSNKPGAYALERAKRHAIPTLVFDKQQFFHSDEIEKKLDSCGISFIVLAGFLWLIPDGLLRKYQGRIVNIHPALLPSYGGKGMYGMRVHEAVAANHDRESGITIHYVDSVYDHGDIIFQARCNVDPADTPGMIAEKVHKLEYEHYPRVVEELLNRGEFNVS